jgi:hypothetical protein
MRLMEGADPSRSSLSLARLKLLDRLARGEKPELSGRDISGF